MEKYQIQTKLFHVEDVLVAWGPIRLTLRQCFVLVLGGCGSLNLWSGLDFLTGQSSIGLVIRIVTTSLPMLLALFVATVRVADRYAEAWAGVLLSYVTRTSVYVWLPQRRLHTSTQRNVRRQKRTTTHPDHRREGEL